MDDQDKIFENIWNNKPAEAKSKAATLPPEPQPAAPEQPLADQLSQKIESLEQRLNSAHYTINNLERVMGSKMSMLRTLQQ